MDLEGKTALVTGGSGDIGGAIARALAQAGADVAISYVGHKQGAAATIDAVRAAGKRSLAVQLDQCDPVSIDAAVDTVVGGLGRVDILVNNAAWNIGIPFSDLAALTADVWDRIMDTNLRGPYLLARAFAPHLRKHGSGRIVNIASVGGLYPQEQQHRVLGQQGGIDPPHALSRRGARPRNIGQLCRARTGRRDADGPASARRGRPDGAEPGGAGAGGQRAGHRRASGHVLPGGFRHRTGARDRRRSAGRDALSSGLPGRGRTRSARLGWSRGFVGARGGRRHASDAQVNNIVAPLGSTLPLYGRPDVVFRR